MTDATPNKETEITLYDNELYSSNDNIISNKDAVQSEEESKGNAEGLTYADIAITSSETGNGVSSRPIIRPESATLYSEVQMYM